MREKRGGWGQERERGRGRVKAMNRGWAKGTGREEEMTSVIGDEDANGKEWISRGRCICIITRQIMETPYHCALPLSSYRWCL